MTRKRESLQEKRRRSQKYKLLQRMNEKGPMTTAELVRGTGTALEAMQTVLWDLMQLGLVEGSDDNPVRWSAVVTAEQMLDIPERSLKHERNASELITKPNMPVMRAHFGNQEKQQGRNAAGLAKKPAKARGKSKLDWQRERIAGDVEAFLKAGGKVAKIPSQERSPGGYRAGW